MTAHVMLNTGKIRSHHSIAASTVHDAAYTIGVFTTQSFIQYSAANNTSVQQYIGIAIHGLSNLSWGLQLRRKYPPRLGLPGLHISKFQDSIILYEIALLHNMIVYYLQ